MTPWKIEDEPDLSTGDKRLLYLADWLEKHIVPKPEKWVFKVWAVLRNVVGLSLEDDEENCRSAGCAIGWACTIPQFAALGLHLEDGRKEGFQQPRYGEVAGHAAAAKFFDIAEGEGVRLFDPSYYGSGESTTVEDVISKIRDFVLERTEEEEIPG